MDTEKIKNAIAILMVQKEHTLTTIANAIIMDNAANRKIMEQSSTERMREAHRQVTVINDLCADFEELIKPKRTKKND